MEHTSVKKTNTASLWNRSYILVLLINTLNAFSFYMISTILSKYLVGIGTTITLAGFIVGLFSITSLVCRPFCGLMSDRLNQVRLLKVSNVFMAAGLLGFAFTTNIPLLISFRILNGVGFAISGTVQISLAARYIPENRMGEGIGYLGMGMVLGSAVAPGLGLAVAEQLGMKGTFLAAALLAIAAYGILFFFHSDGERKTSYSGSRIKFGDILSVRALPFAYVAGAFSFINGMVASYLVLFADEIGIKGISVYFTVCAAVLFMVRPLSGKLMDKRGIRIAVLPALLITAASMFVLGRSSSLLMILVTGVFRSVGQGAAQPSLQAGCIKEVGIEKSGVATSTYYLGGDIFQGFSPMLGGAVIARIAGTAGYRLVFDICGFWMLGAFIFFFWITYKKVQLLKQTK